MPIETKKGADIQAQKLCRSYRMGESEIRAVNDVSFSINSGEFVALLGTSGSGKSSLLNLIAGLDTPTGGSVAVAGRDLARMSREELVGIVAGRVALGFRHLTFLRQLQWLGIADLPFHLPKVPA